MIIRVTNAPMICICGCDVEVPNGTTDDKMQEAVRRALLGGDFEVVEVDEGVEPDTRALKQASWEFEFAPVETDEEDV